MPLIEGPVVVVDARSAFLLRDGLRRWAAEHRARGGGGKVLAVMPVLQAIEAAADVWASRLVDPGPMSARGRADIGSGRPAAQSPVALNSEQTADLLGLTARQVRRLAAAGALPHHRLGQVLMFARDDVQAHKTQRDRRTA